MLIRLLPEQVSREWDTIGEMIAQSLIPTTQHTYEGMVNALYAVLNDDAIVWGYYDGDGFLKAVVVTADHVDKVTRSKALLIYALFSHGDMTPEEWKDGITTLQAFARGGGYHSVLAYSNIPGVVKLARSLGAEVEFALIQFRV